MTSLAFLVLESPWDKPAYGSRRLTVRPFFEGLEKIHPEVTVYYATFYDAASLRAALADLLQAREARQVLYIGSHGSRRRVGEVRLDVLRRLLAEYRPRMHQVEGLLISSCDVFRQQEDLRDLLRQSAFRWAVSYSCDIDWFDSMLIELAILNALAREGDTTYRRSQAQLISFFRRALGIVNLTHSLTGTEQGAVADNLVVASRLRADLEPRLLVLQ